MGNGPGSRVTVLVTCQGLGVTWLDGLFMNILNAFALNYNVRVLHLAPAVTLGAPTVAMLVAAVFIPLYAHLGDRWDRRYVFAIGSVATGMVTYWSFWEFLMASRGGQHHGEGGRVYLAYVVGFGAVFTSVAATCPALIVGLFRPSVRCSGVGLVYQLSRIYGAGLAPTIAQALVTVEHGRPWAVCHYVMAVAVLSAGCALALPKGVKGGEEGEGRGRVNGCQDEEAKLDDQGRVR
jgi:MFS transporter, MHS family, shikimate and dehydroshikimate transport protein